MITRNNYEEFFLLYLDNELSQADKMSVEIFVKENSDLHEELDALRQCRLIPESETSFGRRDLLMKREKDDRFFIPIRFYPMGRIVAASLLLLLTGLGIFIALKKNSDPIAPAGGGIARNEIHPNKVNAKDDDAVSSPAKLHAAKKKDQVNVTLHKPASLYIRSQTPDDPNSDRSDHSPVATKLPVQQEVTLADPKDRDPSERITPQKIVVEDNAGQSNRDIQQEPGSTGASFGTQVVQRETAANPEENFSEQPAAPKNKLRGVFRKISRVFEKTASRDDNDKHQILIGNFQIALK